MPRRASAPPARTIIVTERRSAMSRQQYVAVTSFVALFSIVGLALYGLPFYYDFMVRDFGWSRAQVTSGNALSKLLVGPLFGFMAGWGVDRFGPRRLMMAGILVAGPPLRRVPPLAPLGEFFAVFFVEGAGVRLRGTHAQHGRVSPMF